MSSKKHKIITIGNFGSGKSSVILRLLKNTFSVISPSTIGMNFVSTKIGSECVELMDTAGQERFRSIIPLYLKNCSIILLVIDITTKNISQQLYEWLEIYKENKIYYKNNHSLLILFNKIDNEKDSNFNISQTYIDIISKFTNEDKGVKDIEINSFHSILTISCKENIGLDKLKDEIIKSLSYIEDKQDKSKSVDLDSRKSYSYFYYC